MPPIDQFSFLLGVGVGILIAIFPLYPLWKMYRKWIGARGAYHKPQSIVHKTSKTPAEVARDAKIAGLKIFLFQLAGLVILLGIANFLFPDVIVWIGQVINNLLEMLFG
jgi:hypothetical protein